MRPALLLLGLGAFAQMLSPVGDWTGALDLGATKLRLVFHVQATPDGKLTTTLDSLDQGARGIPVAVTEFTAGTIRWQLPQIGAGFAGKLSPDGQTITGTFSQSGANLPLELKHGTSTAAPRRPQEPQPPFPYREREVRIEHKEATVTLAGTLTAPADQAKHPAVVLVTGSGPQNRNEELLAHKPFLVLADYLTRRGFAVLRYDDRGVGQSTGTFATATTHDFAADAAAAVRFLRAQPEVDARRVGVIGHSEGGLIAAILAAAPARVDFAVLLAAPGLPGSQIIEAQSDALAALNGRSQKSRERIRTEQRTVLQLAVQGTPAEAQQALLKALRETSSGAPESRIESLARQMTSPWYRTYLQLDPATYLAQVKVPLLAVNGSLDIQVDAKDNLAAIRTNLERAGNQQHRAVELPGLNHLFQQAKTGNISEYGEIEQTMSPQVLELVGQWLAEVTAGASR